MSSGRKTLAVRLLLGAVSSWSILCVGPIAYSSVAVGYPLRDRDWNEDEETTVAEFLAAVDIGARPISRGHGACAEYFSFKDGLPLSVVCRAE